MHDLARARGWVAALRAYDGLPRLGSHAREQERLAEALAEAKNPVARQNLIFLTALTVPLSQCEMWLRALADGEDAGDAEDALLALAYGGAADGKEAFLRLAREPSPAKVHGLLDEWDEHEALGHTGTPEAREVLRSYRCIEVLDRVPYFKWTLVEARVHWLGHPDPSDAVDRALRAAWIDRYPGHPGSDDMAYRIARTHARERRWAEAARWYARSASLPDQDLKWAAVDRLLATAELMMSPEEIEAVAHDRGFDTPNRLLLCYVRIRRIAAERGFAAGLAAAAGHAAAEPTSPIAIAYLARAAETVPEEAVQDDPRPYSEIRRAKRLAPPQESRSLDRAAIARQMRAWEVLADLEERTARSRRSERSALLYRRAALLFHDSQVLFPIPYGRVSPSKEDYLDLPVAREDPEMLRQWREAKERWYAHALSLARAVELFDEIERSDPDYPSLDKVLFSRGLARKKLLDLRVPQGSQPAQIAALVADFERCAARFPESPLALDSVAAARYWRRTRPDAFGR